MAEAIGISAIVLGGIGICYIIDAIPYWWDDLMDAIFNNR